MNKKSYKVLALIILLYIISSYLTHSGYLDLSAIPGLESDYAELVYVSIVVLGGVLFGVSTLPLLPFAVSLWGPAAASFLTVTGLVLGSQAAFTIARLFGKKIVCRFIDDCDLDEWRAKLPSRGLFWPLVLARILLPVDVISYAVGLFSKMGWLAYFFSTLVGASIFVIVFTYLSELSAGIQVALALVGTAVLAIFRKRFIRWSKSWWKL